MNNHTLARSRRRNIASPQAIHRIGIVTTVVLVLVLCLFLAGRRLGGAFHQPLTSTTMLLLGISFSAMAGFFRTVWTRTGGTHVMATTWCRLLLPSLAVFLFCYAISLPGSAPWAVALLWFIVVSEEGAWWLAESFALRGARQRTATSRAETHEAEKAVALHSVDLTRDLTSDDARNVVQQMTRTRDQAGNEFVFGQARVEFLSGERSQSIHLAFCPPLAEHPRVSAEHAGGTPAAITVAQAEPFGARFDVRLSATARQQESVMIEFEARCEAADKPPPAKN